MQNLTLSERSVQFHYAKAPLAPCMT